VVTRLLLVSLYNILVVANLLLVGFYDVLVYCVFYFVFYWFGVKFVQCSGG